MQADRDISSEYARQLDEETQRLKDLREARKLRNLHASLDSHMFLSQTLPAPCQLGTMLSPHLAAAGVGGHRAPARAGPTDAGGTTDATENAAVVVNRRSNSRAGLGPISSSIDVSPSTGRSQTVVTRMGAALSAR